MQLIRDKITQPFDCPPLARRRLYDALAESLICCTSTVIQGRAGSGKTQFAADFAQHCGRRIAWYTVDASDKDLPVFLRYFMASVRAQLPGFGGVALDESLAHVGTDDVALVAELFVHELSEARQPLLMVLDDLHLLYDEEWVMPFFKRLLPLLPPEAHLLLIGRSLPPAPLWRLRSKQRLCVVEEATLNFTSDEAIELFRAYGLTAQAATAALAETGGRAALLDARAQELRRTINRRTNTPRAIAHHSRLDALPA